LSYNMLFSEKGATFDVLGQRCGFCKVPPQIGLFGQLVENEKLIRWDSKVCPMCPPEVECVAPAHLLPPLPEPPRAVRVLTPEEFASVNTKKSVTVEPAPVTFNLQRYKKLDKGLKAQLSSVPLVAEKTEVKSAALAGTLLNPCHYCGDENPDHLGRNCSAKSNFLRLFRQLKAGADFDFETVDKDDT